MVPNPENEQKQKTKRVFIALVPQGLTEDSQFKEIFKKIRIGADRKNIDVKWTPFENVHITTNFIGSVNVSRIEDIIAIMQKVSQEVSPFDLEIRHVGVFPDETRARVIWLGVAASKPLVALQHELHEKLVDGGFEQEEREYRPHLTLGRIRKARNARDWISPVVRKAVGKFPAHSLILFESQMRGPHPVYIPLHESSLQGPSGDVEF